MKKYRLKKDLPTFTAGEEFAMSRVSGGLWLIDGYNEDGEWYSSVCAYSEHTLKKFPNILKEWFEEIPEEPKTVWDLREGDEYYAISFDGRVTHEYINEVTLDYHERVIGIGNAFLTKKEAEKELARRKAKVILEQDTKGFKPSRGEKYFKYGRGDEYEHVEVYYDGENLDTTADIGLDGCIYFESHEDAKASIKAHPDEWKTYLGVEE